jgi:hypothetical protein
MTRWGPCLVAFAAVACLGPGAPAARAAELRLCLAQAADYSPVHPTTRFPAGSTDELAAVVRLAKGEAYRTLVATWTAVQAVGAQSNHVISRVSIPIHRRDRAVIHMRSKAGPLPPGTYRLQVAADGTPWPALDFVVAPVEAPVVRAPADMMPLAPGTVWRYAFEQEFAPGVRPSLPAGTKLDPDGRLRATLEKTAAGTDAAGVHIETRRDAVVVEEEWWKLTDAGLAVTKLKSGGEEQTFDPPGAIWPWPLATPRRWEYALDASLKQTFRMWGPVPVKGPDGVAPGYIVLMQQPSAPIALSVERQYLPGVGMVREIVVQARNGFMLTRWESVLVRRP